MKKIITCLAILAALAIALQAGYKTGKTRTIMKSQLFVVDLPNRNENGGFDEEEITVYLEIDGDIYEYGCTIG